MRRKEIFTFRVNDTERALIARLAKCLDRSQSDAVRVAIREKAQELTKGTNNADDKSTTSGESDCSGD